MSTQFQPLESRRLLAAIGPDLAYGTDGIAPDSRDIVLVGLQQDGRLIEQRRDDRTVTLTRRLASGTIDSTFENPAVANAYQVASVVDPRDDAIYTVSSVRLTFEAPTSPPLVRRYAADGTLEDDYTTPLPVPATYKGLTLFIVQPMRIAVDSQGRALVLVTAIYEQPEIGGSDITRVFVDRLLPDGGYDPTFADSGRLFVGEGGTGQVNGLYLNVLPDDGVLVTYTAQSAPARMRAFSASGVLDAGFQSRVDVAWTTDLNSLGIDVDPTGRIVVTGAVSGLLHVERYLPSGASDLNFANGSAIDPSTGRLVYTRTVGDVQTLADGRIVGMIGADLFRLNADGTVDRSFDSDGFAAVHPRLYWQPVLPFGDGLYVSIADGERQGLARVIELPSVALNADGVLRITGTEFADTLSVTLVAGKVRVGLNDEVRAIDAAAVKSLAIDVSWGDDVIAIATDLPARVVLHADNNEFSASAGQYTIQGGNGDDTITTAGGDDLIEPGAGRDRVFAGAGADRVYDTAGDTYVEAGDGDDSIKTAEGNDTVFGNDGRDTIRTSGGDDLLAGGGGRNRLFGGAGNDTLTGGGNVDRLNGGAGADQLFGYRGDDLLIDSTDPGIDTLDGGSGTDQGLFDDADDVTSIESVLNAI